MKRQLVLCLAFLLSSCASEPFPPEPLIVPEAHEIVNQEPTGFKPLAGPATLKDYYNILLEGEPSYAFLKKGEAKEEGEPAGKFLKVVTPDMTPGSAFVFALFPGEGKDLVVVQAKRCGQGCSYSYAAYSFTASDYSFLLFSSLLPKEEIEKTAHRAIPAPKGRSRRRRGAVVVSGWPRAEHLRINIPTSKDSIPLYVLRELSSRKKEEVTYYDLGSLTWNKANYHFDFSAHPRAKALGKLDAY